MKKTLFAIIVAFNLVGLIPRSLHRLRVVARDLRARVSCPRRPEVDGYLNTSLLATGIIILLTCLGVARAQTDDAEQKPVPKAPYFAPVPDYGHWMVKFKYKDDSATGAASPASGAVSTPNSSSSATSGPGTDTAKPPVAPPVDIGSPTSIETIKTGDLRGVTLTFADGSSEEFTCQGDWVLSSTSKGPQLSIASPTALPYAYYTTGFILLDGVKIDLSTFKEAAKHNGVMAFHYKSGAVDVWVDPNSMLPLGAKAEGVEISYEFLTPPPRPFPIPKDQEGLLQKEQAAAKTTSSMR